MKNSLPPPLRLLLIIEQCNPEWVSVPLVGYKFYREIRKLTDCHLVTHIRNKEALEKVRGGYKITYIAESRSIKKYYRMVALLTNRGAVNWPLQHALSYPVYEQFNRQVSQIFAPAVKNGEYDVVHAITPMLPRYPYKIIDACNNTPFILGPVNGGVPFPAGFEEVARQESAQFNFLRAFNRLIPGYTKTYRQADYILAGSSYTKDFLKEMFNLSADRLELYPENGIDKEFFTGPKTADASGIINLLFVGRLVPYKGVDIILDALHLLPQDINCRLTIVGDGSEKANLLNKAKELRLQEIVNFTGWVNQESIKNYYTQADIFCFPSIREFGGAVVLEAMACGMPAIVVNNGGIAEYVTEATGFKIEPRSRFFIVQELARYIQLLCQDRQLRGRLSKHALLRAGQFEWGNKGQHILETYKKVLALPKQSGIV